MDAKTLALAMPGLDTPKAEEVLPDLLAAMARGEITTLRRAQYFFAQLGHESMSLRYFWSASSSTWTSCPWRATNPLARLSVAFPGWGGSRCSATWSAVSATRTTSRKPARARGEVAVDVLAARIKVAPVEQDGGTPLATSVQEDLTREGLRRVAAEGEDRQAEVAEPRLEGRRLRVL